MYPILTTTLASVLFAASITVTLVGHPVPAIAAPPARVATAVAAAPVVPVAPVAPVAPYAIRRSQQGRAAL